MKLNKIKRKYTTRSVCEFCGKRLNINKAIEKHHDLFLEKKTLKELYRLD
jgi:NifB/MoaA-like Fe-S oxidoreductase